MSRQTKTRGLIKFLNDERARFIRRDESGEWELGHALPDGQLDIAASGGTNAEDANELAEHMFDTIMKVRK